MQLKLSRSNNDVLKLIFPLQKKTNQPMWNFFLQYNNLETYASGMGKFKNLRFESGWTLLQGL